VLEKNCRAVAAGQVSAARWPPGENFKTKIFESTQKQHDEKTNYIRLFCINKSKSEAAFRDNVSMSAVNFTFPLVDDAKLDIKKASGNFCRPPCRISCRSCRILCRWLRTEGLT
jgi:hypothetical protein